MDLSWCIICDRHCTDNNLYCSEACKFQDCPDSGNPSFLKATQSPPFLTSTQPTSIYHHPSHTQFVPYSISPCSLYDT
ncbi:hypothetical protein A0J61_09007 [Choanephora cucurbitarum]|uniref:Uncharacterized protein n=1 Tax=Choanephora cucurbitarum TaxID=101091 RepID=A0A1C7N1H3_9FUNG|nr:hypothetical protein A0J61_09007 [Choanephora cucurbitarum]